MRTALSVRGLLPARRWPAATCCPASIRTAACSSCSIPCISIPHFMQAVRNIRYRGVATKVLLALDSLPPMPASASAMMIAPSIRYVERAYDAIKYGRCSEEPVVEMRFPSVNRGWSGAKRQACRSAARAVHALRFTRFDSRPRHRARREASAGVLLAHQGARGVLAPSISNRDSVCAKALFRKAR